MNTLSYNELLKLCVKTRLSLTQKVHPTNFLQLVKHEAFIANYQLESSQENYVFEYFKIFWNENFLK